MSAITKEYIASIVSKIVAANNFTDYNYTEENFGSIAQNFFGMLIPISLKATCRGKAETVDLVLKLAPTDERYRVSGAVTLMFAREIYAYTSLLEKYREIQQNFPLKLQHLMPKCYFVCKDYCNEVIAMENMCANGYAPFTHLNVVDFDHTVLSLEALAKFHALSLILKETDPGMFEEVERICVPFTQDTNSRFMFIILDRLEKAIGKFENEEPMYTRILKNMKENCKKHVEAAAFAIQQKCICHGDIWKENILYKYGEDGKPIQACLIDYQTVRISSAAFDTLFFITTSTNRLERQPKETFYKLLDLYYEKFVSVLQAAGLDSEKVYSRKMFDADLKIVAPACFIIANTAIWLSSGLQEQGHVRSKQVFNTQSEREEAVSAYRRRIVDIIDDYVSYNYFDSLDSYN